jgi:hypothetical protein
LSQEELEELEDELNETLGDFDEQMQREQTYAEERANENAAEDSLGGIGTFDDYEEEAEEETAGGKAAKGSASESGSEGSSESGEESESSEKGASSTAKNSRKGDNPARREGEEGSTDDAKDIPSGHDDDIVARQIREAAENESDPELREKLWEEYRRYKNQ